MRVYITTEYTYEYDDYCKEDVRIGTTKPTKWDEQDRYYDDPQSTVICRKQMRRLLRETGLRLPRHGSQDIVEVELTASKPGHA